MAAMTAEAVGAQHRAAVVCVDHVAKHTNRGRFALGGQHKMAGLSRAAHIMEMEQPFAIGQCGVANVRVGKDRPGRVRLSINGNHKSLTSNIIGWWKKEGVYWQPPRTMGR
jgi:hypothetical protein